MTASAHPRTSIVSVQNISIFFSWEFGTRLFRHKVTELAILPSEVTVGVGVLMCWSLV